MWKLSSVCVSVCLSFYLLRCLSNLCFDSNCLLFLHLDSGLEAALHQIHIFLKIYRLPPLPPTFLKA